MNETEDDVETREEAIWGPLLDELDDLEAE